MAEAVVGHEDRPRRQRLTTKISPYATKNRIANQQVQMPTCGTKVSWYLTAFLSRLEKNISEMTQKITATTYSATWVRLMGSRRPCIRLSFGFICFTLPDDCSDDHRDGHQQHHGFTHLCFLSNNTDTEVISARGCVPLNSTQIVKKQ